ncbi:unnamed protein product [Blepharisma stoltei]|uniref:F-BAR domain-containing protein n=1 Tax=Blepharisma stoltei TaxID=1481888 RepID=A0AAU9J1H1_9CILI|nr:unnamed protein product [Blepharisma stoltei]
MSFRENLHDQFELVHNHCLHRRKGGEEFIQLLKERAQHEESYARGLERLGNHPYFVTSQGTLSHAISAMKNDNLNKAMQAKILAESITNDLVEPFKELLRNQGNTLKKASAEGKKLEKDKAMLKERVEKSKGRYVRACMECEQLTILLEQPIPQVKREKLVQRLILSKKEVEDSMKQNIEAVNAYNSYQTRYCDMMAMILEIYQKQEEQRLEAMKDSLRKLVVYETSCLRNLQYDIDNLAHSMESVNIQADINQFIDENTSNNPKMILLEFEPYQGTHPSFKEVKHNAPIVTIPHSITTSDSQALNALQDVYKSEISNILQKTWNAENLSPEEFHQFRNIIKDPSARQCFTSVLGQKKTQGDVSLSEKSFEQMGELLLVVLNECALTTDIRTSRNLIQLSQVFRKAQGSPNAPLEYLQNLIISHSIWASMEFWEGIIQSAIDEDIQSHEVYGLHENETQESIENRIKNIVFCQLGVFGNTMLTFQVDTMYAAELVSKYACKYQLSSEDMDTLMATIDKKFSAKTDKEEEVVQEVQRGVPKWLHELEGATATMNKRIKKDNKVNEESKTEEHENPEETYKQAENPEETNKTEEIKESDSLEIVREEVSKEEIEKEAEQEP